MKELFHRVSIRRFEDRPVEEEKITEILRAAMQASGIRSSSGGWRRPGLIPARRRRRPS